MSEITNVITLAEYATHHKLDATRLRRVARQFNWPGDVKPFKFGGKTGGLWCIARSAPAIVLPDKSTRGARRADGRRRHIVFANTVELNAVREIVGGDNVIDPRVASKKRRDNRKSAAELENDENE